MHIPSLYIFIYLYINILIYNNKLGNRKDYYSIKKIRLA